MTPPAGPPLLEWAAGGRATITLNRPQHLNRLHREDLLALQDHFARIAADPGVRVLVLTGSGCGFCAGFHLGELDESTDSASDDPRLFEHTVDELLRIGYLDTVVTPEQLDVEVDAIAAALAGNAPLAVRGMKQSLNEIARGDFDLPWLREREAECAASADLREGLAAFAERRDLQFTGR